jgi:hypothetical protein
MSMETKNNITLEVEKNGFNFVFHMPYGASWGSAIDASFEILQYITELSRQSVEKAKPEQGE